MKANEVRNQRIILLVGVVAFVVLFGWRVLSVRPIERTAKKVVAPASQPRPAATPSVAVVTPPAPKPQVIEPTPEPPRIGWLRIICDPPTATFEVSRPGTSGLRGSGSDPVGPIRVGEVTVIFQHGDQRFTTKATVDERTTNEVRHAFEYAIAHFRTTPAGAKVSINGREVGVTPVLVNTLRVGTNIVQLSLRGYLGHSFLLVGTAGTPQSVEDVLVNEELAERSAKAREAAAAGDFETALANLKVIKILNTDGRDYSGVEKTWKIGLQLKRAKAAIARSSEDDASAILNELKQLDPDNVEVKAVDQELAGLKARRAQAELEERFSNQLFQAERTYAVGPLDRALEDVDAALKTRPGDPKASALRLKVLAAIEAEQARRREISMREGLIAVRGNLPNYSLYDNAEWRFKGTPDEVWGAIQAAIRQPKHTWTILNQKKATNGVYYAQIQMSGSFKPTKSGLLFIGKGEEDDVLVLSSFLEYVTGDDYKPLPVHPDYWHRDTPQDARDRRKDTRDAFETAVRKELAIQRGR